MLSQAQRTSYQDNGFLVLEGFVEGSVCRELIRQARRLVGNFDAEAHRSVFSTRDQSRTSDDYFLGSGNRVRFFFEEEALDADGRLTVNKERAINKIGHALHKLDPVFAPFSRDPRFTRIAQDLGLAEPRLIQSMYIYKQPRIGGEVGLHQDATFLYTEPVSVTGFWIALEDAHVENGCLYAQPGGHAGGLKRRFKRSPRGGTEFETLDATDFPAVDPVPLEVAAGTLVVLHGLLPHFSGPNRSETSRQAYSLHFVDATARYPADNWLRPD